MLFKLIKTGAIEMSKPSGTNSHRHSEQDSCCYHQTEIAFNGSSLSLLDKLEAFPRFATKRSIARFLTKYEIYQQLLSVPGVIIECGVFNGGGYLLGRNSPIFLSR